MATLKSATNKGDLAKIVLFRFVGKLASVAP